jgi:hypothetical protein
MLGLWSIDRAHELLTVADPQGGGVSLAMIVPTRDRPHNITRLLRECAAPAARTTRIVLGVDEDQAAIYRAGLPYSNIDIVSMPMREYLVPKLNRIAMAYAALGYTHIGFMGDDHIPRTQGWDLALCHACGKVGGAYGDDLEHGEELPTYLVMSAAIVRTLRAFCPAPVKHLCCDMAWRDVTRGAGLLTYVPDVVIEHMHPEMPGTRHRGRAPMDAQYEATRTPEMYDHDNTAYERWREHTMPGEVRRLLNVADVARMGSVMS